jgi:glycosyltransferase involved in cell wall biosynthesis
MKISVITVAFNSVKTITHTLDTVAMQTHVDIEHLVIDGASTDGTVGTVIGHNSPQIRIISEVDKGIYDAMNKGLAYATGEVIGFLNSDDFYADADVLAKVANAFEDPAVDACYADLMYVAQDNSRVIRYWKSKPFKKGDFARGWCPAHPTFYVRKSVILRLGLFDLSYKLASDMEFMLRYLERGQVSAIYIPYVLVHMRVGGVSNQNWKNIVHQNKEILAALRKNNVPFSTIWFLVSKIASRLLQFGAGSLK